MFGYVNICKPELKVKDYITYRSYYCGLCHVLQQRFGPVAKMTLSYDITFLVVFLSSLYEPQTQETKRRCVVHPIEKRPMKENEITKYAADMNIVLMYYNFVDDWIDDHKPSAMVGIRSIHKSFVKVEQKYPQKCSKIKKCLQRLKKAEDANEHNIDLVSGCFGELLSELFAYRKDVWEDTVRKMAFYLGKYIYLMDACDDIENDLKSGNYNPLTLLYESCQREDISFYDKCEELLTMMMAQCTMQFEKLPCVNEVDIISNILYAGVWSKFDKLRKTDTENESIVNSRK